MVSCPDLQADDFEPGDLEKYEQVEEQSSRETLVDEHIRKQEDFMMEAEAPQRIAKIDEELNIITENPISEVTSETTVPTIVSAEKIDVDEGTTTEVKEEEIPVSKEEEITMAPTAIPEEIDKTKSRDTLVGIENMPGYKPPPETAEAEEEQELESDLERLKAAQEQEAQIEAVKEEEAPPGMDEEIEMFKKHLYGEQVPIAGDLSHYADIPSEQSLYVQEISSAEKAALLDEQQGSIVNKILFFLF